MTYACCSLYPVFPIGTSSQFLSLSFIQNPNRQNEVRILNINFSKFSDHTVWLFPFLCISRTGNITGWVFRVDPLPPQGWTWTTDNSPSFELWQENAATPNQEDYSCVSCSTLIRTIEPNVDNPNVYSQLLTSPLSVAAAQGYILGVRLPRQAANNLNLTFLETNDITNERSYYTNLNTNFLTITEGIYRDNSHIPLVSPLYGKLRIFTATLPLACMYMTPSMCMKTMRNI